ncbi:MAG: hypothetical protein AMXMBFR44_4640 [Candidatus Campbellbacteria bacterium]
MPVIKLWCLPADQSEDDLRKVHKAVVAAVVAIPELCLKDETQMTCLFPPDMMTYGLGEEIVVEIGGLFKRTSRTPEVCQRLAESVGTAVHNLYPDAKVECFVQTFSPSEGFWESQVDPNPHRAIRQMERLFPSLRDQGGS